MRGRKALVLGLAIVLAVTALAVVSCGGGNDQAAKDALKAALAVVDTKVDAFTASAITSTVPELKAAKDALAPYWQAVVDAAKDVKDADVPAAEKAWTDLSAAVDGLADDASLMTVGPALLPVAQAVLDVKTDLHALVGDAIE